MKMMKSFRIGLIAGVGMLAPSFVNAHGENKPGPHGGYIRMPGAFHTELLKVSDSLFRVYLVDVNSKNPTTKRSSVLATIKKQSKEEKVICKGKGNAFECSLPKGWKWSDFSEVSVEANRDGNSGGVVSYKFPLRYE